MEDFNRFRSAKLRVAAAQIEPTEADISDNLKATPLPAGGLSILSRFGLSETEGG